MAFSDDLRLTVISPEKTVLDIHCELVTFRTPDGKDGSNGGSMGVRKGHISTVAVLDKCVLSASSGGKTLQSLEISGGIAMIESNTVTVLLG